MQKVKFIYLLKVINYMERPVGKWGKYYIKENPKRFFYPREWLDFINNVPARYKFFFNFLLQTGMRFREAAEVRVEDIDFDRNTIFVRFAKTRTSKPKKYIVCECGEKINYNKKISFCPRCGRKLDKNKIIIKGKQETRRKTRYIKISQAFAGELLAFIKQNKLKKNDLLFQLDNKKVKYVTLNHILKNVCKKIGIKDWKDFSIHNIRKTHENYMLAINNNVLALSQHMGHTIDVASGYYVANTLFNEQDKGMVRTILNNLQL